MKKAVFGLIIVALIFAIGLISHKLTPPPAAHMTSEDRKIVDHLLRGAAKERAEQERAYWARRL